MTDQRLSVAERNTVCVGSVAFLTGEIEYSLDKTPDLHGNGAEAAGQKRDQKLNERALCEAEIEVVHAETAEEYAEKTCGKLGFTRSILGGGLGLGLGLRLSLLSFGILSAFACNGSAAVGAESRAVLKLCTAIFAEYECVLLDVCYRRRQIVSTPPG